MKPVQLMVNGRPISEAIEPRMHLADFLRERLRLTGTHLRCEQGACGACTLLIDGQPARSCLTYTVLCDGAEITTIEGLENDPVMVALRRAFSQEHGLQCGYCTPGMLMTARDIVLRIPGADQRRIREEISGNLCRCTGYVGIVRAITRVLGERSRGVFAELRSQESPIGPVGSRRAQAAAGSAAASSVTAMQLRDTAAAGIALGLAGRQPNFEISRSFTVSRPPAAVWAFFADIERVVRCLPGASLTQPPADDNIQGRMSVKLGPITANFAGRARIQRDAVRKRGRIMGAGTDTLGGSRAAGEVEYALEPSGAGATRVNLIVRALLIGPLAQFGRSGIVEILAARITDAFAGNVEARLSGAPDIELGAPAPLQMGALFRQIAAVRLKALFARLLRRPHA